jgi:hypothetical protein
MAIRFGYPGFFTINSHKIEVNKITKCIGVENTNGKDVFQVSNNLFIKNKEALDIKAASSESQSLNFNENDFRES